MRWLRERFLPVASLMVFTSAVGCAMVVLACPVKADPITDRASVYAAQHFPAMCANLALLPNVESVESVVVRAIRDGLSGAEAGQAVTVAVAVGCPQFGYLLDAFIAKWAPAPRPAPVPVTAGVGGVLR